MVVSPCIVPFQILLRTDCRHHEDATMHHQHDPLSYCRLLDDYIVLLSQIES
jgi:hypothetical protein